MAASGLKVIERPLMTMEAAGLAEIPEMEGIHLRPVGPDDDLATLAAVAHLGFANAGTEVGTTGIEALEAARDETADGQIQVQRERIVDGRAVSAVAWNEGHPIAYGGHQPIDDVSEVVGVATLPAFRRRGVGAALTAYLARDAFERGVKTLFLSASDEAVARTYARIGFRTIGVFADAAPR